jgi:hypothetical protein
VHGAGLGVSPLSRYYAGEQEQPGLLSAPLRALPLPREWTVSRHCRRAHVAPGPSQPPIPAGRLSTGDPSVVRRRVKGALEASGETATSSPKRTSGPRSSRARSLAAIRWPASSRG